MPLVNPVPVFSFNVFLMDAEPISSASSALAAAGGVAVGVLKSIVTGTFAEVSGLNAEMEIEEYRVGGSNEGPRKFVKWGRYPNLVLKRGVTLNTDLWDWYYQVLYGKESMLRKNGVILLTDRGGGLTTGSESSGLGLPGIDRMPVAAWSFSNGLPEKLQGPGLNAKSNEIAIESLEISHEGLVRIGLAQIPGVGEALTAVGL